MRRALAMFGLAGWLMAVCAGWSAGSELAPDDIRWDESLAAPAMLPVSIRAVDEPQREAVPECCAESAATRQSRCSRCRCYQPSACEPVRLLPAVKRTQIYGWVDVGAPLNTVDPPSGFNGPFNTQNIAAGQLNQLYLIGERKLDPCAAGLDFGGRIDLLYGTDYFYGQSLGQELNSNGSPRWNRDYYGLAIPQAYGQVGLGDVSVKVGHFYTVVGYEGVPAPANFFYTHSYAYQFAGPFTHWGALSTLKLTEQTELDAGVVNGWNSIDWRGNRASALGRATRYSDDRRRKLVGSVVTGDQFAVTGQLGNRTRYDLYWDVQLTDRLQFVLQYNGAYQQNGTADGGVASWFGVANYLYYQIDSRWKAGFRGEWFRDSNGTRVTAASLNNPNVGPFRGDFNEVSFGLNWAPNANLRVRPELRYDWYNGAGTPFDGINSQMLLGCDGILQF